jgi:hypothetical protein
LSREKEKFNLSVRFSKDEKKLGRIRQGLQTEYEKKIRELVRLVNFEAQIYKIYKITIQY